MTQPLTYAESITIAATPEQVYELVTDITRTGEWSPVCKACWWDEGDSARVGAWFTGRNETPQRTWETRSQVVAAEEGRAFGWSVGPGRVNWTYTMREISDRVSDNAESTAGASTESTGGPLTELTETWEFTREGQAYFDVLFGSDAHAQIVQQEAAAKVGIPATLAAMKRIIEGS
ncbi:MAG: SRPBCC family protein [Leucobacter sp.]|jgi:ribosome-associated toxin RatA of RatAB toxin-antitoxin module|nr:SRPBCC family protein [Leucobacter sp.]